MGGFCRCRLMEGMFARIIPAALSRIKGKKVIEPMTKEDLTSPVGGCYGK
jgi:hypothetical protein